MRRAPKRIPISFEKVRDASEQTSSYCLSERDVLLLLSQTDYTHWPTRYEKSDNSRLSDYEKVLIEDWASHAESALVNDTLPGCPEDEPECVEYLPSSSRVQYAPNNPFNPGLPPEGYDRNPLYTGDNSIFPGFLSTDVLADIISSLPDSILDLPDLILTSGLPRWRVVFSGTGQIELHLLKIPQGGLAIITTDSDPFSYDLVDLSSITATTQIAVETILELIDAAGELDVTGVYIYEKEITSPGSHYIDVTLIPNVEYSPGIPLPVPLWGGGLRKVVLCGFDEEAGVIIVEGGSMGVIGEVDWLECDDCPPETHLLCDGEIYDKADYLDLYNAIAAAHKLPGGIQFKVPDYRRRSPFGRGDDDETGDQFGEESHTLTQGEMAEHNHSQNNYGYPEIALTDRNSTVQQPGTLAGKFGWDVYPLSNLSAFQAINRNNTAYQGDNIAHNNIHPVNITLPCIRFKNPDVVGLKGSPGTPGAPGVDGDCPDCDEGTEAPPLPPVDPGTLPPGTDVKCAAANVAWEFLDAKLLSALRELDNLEIVLISVAGAIFGVLAGFFTGGSVYWVTIAAGASLLGLVGWMISETNWRDKWDNEFRDDLICKIYCAIEDDGQFNGDGFQEFKNGIAEESGGEWEIIRVLNNLGGASMWNNIMQARLAVRTDGCENCGCGFARPVRIDDPDESRRVDDLGAGRWRVRSFFLSNPADSYSLKFEFEDEAGNRVCVTLEDVVFTIIDPPSPLSASSKWQDCDNVSTNMNMSPGGNLGIVDGTGVQQIHMSLFGADALWQVEFTITGIV